MTALPHLAILDIIQRFAPRDHFLGHNPRSKYLMACPLCNYHSRSGRDVYFTVSEDQKLFKCFVCGAQGNAYQLQQLLLDPTRHTQPLLPTGPKQRRRSALTEIPIGTTVAEVAAAKGLDPHFLRRIMSWHDTEEWYGRLIPTVVMPYYSAEGRLSLRHRVALTGDRFRWVRGSKVSLYGLQHLDRLRKHGWVVLVEGETDTVQLLQRGIPALGVPGVDTWKQEWKKQLEGFEKIYVWQETDKAGQKLAQALCHTIPTAFVITAPPFAKDPCELAAMAKDKFKDAFDALIAQAKQLSLPASLTSRPDFLPRRGRGIGYALLRPYRQVNLAEYVSRFTKLQPVAPGRWNGRCPIHDGGPPSFLVTANPWRWHCFGTCATGGDLVKLIAELRRVGKRGDWHDHARSQ